MQRLKYEMLCLLLIITCSVHSQQITRDQLIALTPEWKGERFADGRPKVPDSLLDRMKLVSLEEAWAVLRNENFKHQYDGDGEWVKDSFITLSEKPGIGVEINEEGMKKYALPGVPFFE